MDSVADTPRIACLCTREHGDDMTLNKSESPKIQTRLCHDGESED